MIKLILRREYNNLSKTFRKNVSYNIITTPYNRNKGVRTEVAYSSDHFQSGA